MFLSRELLHRHIDDILSFWKPAVDHEQGGIHFFAESSGSDPFRDTGRKCLLMHARQLYNYSVGIEYRHPGAEQIAHHLYTTLDTVFPPENGLYPSPVGFWRHHASQTKPKLAPQYRAYDQYYLVAGLARYAAATRSRQPFNQACSLFEQASAIFCGSAFQSRGSAVAYDPGAGTVHGVSGNTDLHYVEALVNLSRAAQQVLDKENIDVFLASVRERLAAAYRFFDTVLYDRDTLSTPEELGDDLRMSAEQRCSNVTMAHPLEWVGFWYEAEQLTGIAVPFLAHESCELTRAIVERAVAPNGCFRNNYYLVEKRCDTVSQFWSQTEGVLGLLYAAALHKEPAWREAADRVALFYFEHYRNREEGGIYSRVSEGGIVLDRTRGDPFKCDHHSLRMCEKILEWNLL